MTETSFDEPDGIIPRGTLIVAGGRGENARAYARFGRRIAADGYRVRVLGDVTTDLGASVAEVEKLLVDDGLPGPKVIAGSDTGALFGLAVAGRRAAGLDGLILAGLPDISAGTAGQGTSRPGTSRPGTAGQGTAGQGVGPGLDLGWTTEVEARTACPNHQRLLGDGAATPGALLSGQIPIELIEMAGYSTTLPILGVHGGADLISPLDRVRDRYPRGATARLVAIEGGRHDILNDVTHRTVAALVVLFLERLRLGDDLPLIARPAA